MKKFTILFLASALYAQSPQTLPSVTGIQAVNVLNDAVVLEWLSDSAEAVPGDFIFYYNPTNAISSLQMQNDSRIVRPRNFRSSPRGGRTLYSAEIPLNVSGEYYFALAPSKGISLDEAIRQNKPLSSAFRLQPEQSYTVQPLSFRLRGVPQTSGLVSNLGSPAQLLVKSLRLSSEEDIFRLTWMVSQADRSSYVFRIYRSRYPLAELFNNQRFKYLDNLPVYALVENKFYFEDRNISFETPYYYAVVAEGSTQWDSGLNVFSNPAVLVRKSPPFTLSPQQEAVKQVRPFAVQQSGLMTETDIEKAVQQTLSNLIYAPAYTNEQQNIPQMIPPNIEPMSPQEFLNNPNQTVPAPNAPAQAISYRGSLNREIEADDPALLESFYRGLAGSYNALVQKEKGLEEKVSTENKKESARFLADIQGLKKDIFAYTQVQAALAQSSGLSDTRFLPLVSDFLKKRDQIFLKEFTLKNNRSMISARMEGRKKDLLVQLKDAQDAYFKSLGTLKAEHKKSLQDLTLKLQNEQKALTEAQNKRIDNYNKKSELSARIAALTQRVQQSASKENIPLSAEILPYMSPLTVKAPLLSQLDDPNFYALPQLLKPEARLQNMQDDSLILNEIIPNLAQLEEASAKKESWLLKKVDWLTNNSQIWNENIAAWKDRIPFLFKPAEAYDKIVSTWDVPNMPISPQTAYQKGKQAFDQSNYGEAAFFFVKIPDNNNALMMLGQSFYQMGHYKEAVTAFSSAYQMGIPGAQPWLLEASQKYIAGMEQQIGPEVR